MSRANAEIALGDIADSALPAKPLSKIDGMTPSIRFAIKGVGVVGENLKTSSSTAKCMKGSSPAPIRSGEPIWNTSLMMSSSVLSWPSKLRQASKASRQFEDQFDGKESPSRLD